MFGCSVSTAADLLGGKMGWWDGEGGVARHGAARSCNARLTNEWDEERDAMR